MPDWQPSSGPGPSGPAANDRPRKRHRTCGGAIAGLSLIFVLALVISGCGGGDRAGAPIPAGPSATGTTASGAGTPTGAGPTPAEPPSHAPSGRPRPTSSTTPTPKPRAGTALAAAAALTVKGRAPKTGYDRDQFGAPWVDVDGNGCDQRNDVLNRDLTHKTFDGCLVLRGTLHDPYTGRVIQFRRGETTSAAVQIDHVVALSDAWQKGAQQWSSEKRTRFANDTLNLYAVDGPTNEGKGDGDTATWLPSNKSFRCTYVAHQVAVKAKYKLWVTSAEQQAMVRVLSGCSAMKLPKRAKIPAHPAPSRTDSGNTGGGAGANQDTGSDGNDSGSAGSGGGRCAPGYDPCVPPYPPDVDCSDVNGPIIVTGSDPHRLDGDGDGIACED